MPRRSPSPRLPLRLAFAGLLLLLVGGVAAAPALPVGGPVDWTALVSCHGPLPRDLEAVEPSDPSVRVHVDAFCPDEAAGALAPSPSASTASLTDCARTTYVLKPWRWVVPYLPKADVSGSGLAPAEALAAFQGAVDAWDDAVLAEIGGTVALGGVGTNAGYFDASNQFGWKPLASGAIATTTTWYHAESGAALESDAAYNTAFSWSVTGSSGAMDLQHIATHEVGHSFGLADLYDGADSCLTMYGYGANGWTHARTLGDGDVLGLRARYGP